MAFGINFLIFWAVIGLMIFSIFGLTIFFSSRLIDFIKKIARKIAEKIREYSWPFIFALGAL